jgi:hypothetical protein
LQIYTFEYNSEEPGKRHTGTMAQDLLALGYDRAVSVGMNGYYEVDYDLLDVDSP